MSNHRGASSNSQTPALDPSFVYSEFDGCSDVVVVANNKARTEMLSILVPVDRKWFPGASRPVTVDLVKPPHGVQVQIEVFTSGRHNWPCSDLGDWGGPDVKSSGVTWVARAGRLMVIAGTMSRMGDYPVTVTLTNAVFEAPTGKQVRPKGPVIIKTRAGRIVGG